MYLVYTKENSLASAVAEKTREAMGFSEDRLRNGHRHWTSESAKMLEIDGNPVFADFLDSELDTERIIFISKHTSAKGILSFTAHSEGNWSDDNKLGGRPKELSVSSPEYMLRFLKSMKAVEHEIPVTYEATHHGPFLKTPSLFVELGPIDAVVNDSLIHYFAEGIANMLSGDAPEFGKVALGIGGLHYCEKFTKLALEGKYAFSHIMSKYYVNETDMIAKAIKASEKAPEVAVIEWKSIKAEARNKIIDELGSLGIDYERA